MSSESVPMTLTQTAYKSLAGGYVEQPVGGGDLVLSGALTNIKTVGLLFTPSPFRQNPDRLFPVAPPPFDSLVFTVYLYSLSSVGPFTVGSSLVVDEALSFYSSTSPPGSFTIRALTASPSAVTLTAGVPQAVTLTAGGADRNALKAVMEAAGWVGTIGVRVTASSLADSPVVYVLNSSLGLSSATATREVDDVRGKSGLGDFGTVDRVRECPRCGTPTLEGEMIEDGYRRGLLVCPPCWDPPDRRYLPLPGVRRGSY